MFVLRAPRRFRSSMLFAGVVCLVLAGCAGAPTASRSPAATTTPTSSPWSPDAANLSVPAHWLNLTKCDELTYTTTVPNALGASFPPGVEPTQVGPSKAFQQVDVTYQRCERAQNASADAPLPTSRFLLVRVQPVSKLTLPGVSSYYYGTDVASTLPVVVESFNNTGPDVRLAQIVLAFGNVGSGAKNQGTAQYMTGPTDRVDVASAMSGSAGAGKAGVLGLYTSDNRFLYLHAVRFSDYHAYATGGATVRHVGDANSPDSTDVESWPAVHNLAYDLRFEFNVQSRPVGT